MSLHFRNVQSVRVKTGKSNSHKFESTSLISWYELAQLSGYGDGSFSMFSGSPHRPIPVRCNWVVFARKMHSTTEFATTVVRVCVCVPLFQNMFQGVIVSGMSCSCRWRRSFLSVQICATQQNRAIARRCSYHLLLTQRNRTNWGNISWKVAIFRNTMDHGWISDSDG